MVERDFARAMRLDFAPTPQQYLDRLRYATDKSYNKNLAAIELSVRLLYMLGMSYQVFKEGTGKEEIPDAFEGLIISKIKELLNRVTLHDDIEVEKGGR